MCKMIHSERTRNKKPKTIKDIYYATDFYHANC